VIQDAATLFSDAQAITTGAANSTNIYDLLVARDTGPGDDLTAWWIVNVAFTSGGSGTLDVALVAADNTALSSNPTTLRSTGALAKTTLVAGYRRQFVIPRNQVYALGQRYLGFIYTVATADMTAGKITSGLGLPPAFDDSDKIYPRASYGVA
jgi:hypothetical protein